MRVHGVELCGRGAATELFPIELGEGIEARADGVFVDELRLDGVPPRIVAARETLDDFGVLCGDVAEFAAIGAEIEKLPSGRATTLDGNEVPTRFAHGAVFKFGEAGIGKFWPAADVS